MGQLGSGLVTLTDPRGGEFVRKLTLKARL